MKKILCTLLFAALASMSPAAMLITSPGTGGLLDNNTYTIGMNTFTVGASDLSVTQLGLLNIDASGALKAGGLLSSHQIGLWTVVGNTLVTSVTITAGTGAGSLWAFADITPVTLTAGVSYRLGASWTSGSGDYYRNSAASPTFSSDASGYAGGYSASPGVFAAPTTLAFGKAYVGPNLTYTAVPEPGTWILTGMGLTALVVFRRRSPQA